MSKRADTVSKPYHHGDLRAALIDTGLNMLESVGAGSLSLTAIAHAVGVKPPSVYHHFKNKSALLRAISDEGIKLRTDAMKAAAEAAPANERLMALALAYVRFAHAYPALHNLIFEESRVEPKLRKQDEASYRLVREAVIGAGVVPEGSPMQEVAMVAFFCAVAGVAEIDRYVKLQGLRDSLGGEQEFLRAVLRHLGIFT